MSYIAFHGRDGLGVEVRGPERAHAGGVTMDMFLGLLGLDRSWSVSSERPRYVDLFRPQSHYALNPWNADAFSTALRVGMSAEGFEIDGQTIDAFTLSLNTALAVGSDPIKLMARLHGQCEIHAWVDGPNRAWLADIVEEGRDIGVLRAEMGWEQLIEYLRSSDQSEVVTSYSVTESFPDVAIAEKGGRNRLTDQHDDSHLGHMWEYEGRSYCSTCDDMWYDEPDDQKWDVAMAGLRTEGGSLELRPDSWDAMWFGPDTKKRYTVFDVVEEAYRLDRIARPDRYAAPYKPVPAA